MNQGTKMLMMAAGIVLTLLIITFAFTAYNRSQDTANAALNKADKLAQEMLVSDKTQYDGKEVSGNDVLNAIQQFKSEEFCVWVVTKKTASSSGTQYIYTLNSEADNKFSLNSTSDKSIADAKKVAHNSYINPSGDFLGSVLYDVNGTIVGIKFVQQ